jgi:hypothetical protein
MGMVRTADATADAPGLGTARKAGLIANVLAVGSAARTIGCFDQPMPKR